MVPTGYNNYDGTPGTAANHVFKIIQPIDAVEASATVQLHLDTDPLPAPTTVSLPYSACSKCHSRPGDEQATWVQDTLTDRQNAMKAWDAQTTTLLQAAAVKLGFKDAAATSTAPATTAIMNANTALNAIATNSSGTVDTSKWNSSRLAFQKAFTNQQYIESEGSWGIHNWDYARTVILQAKNEAQSVKGVGVITIKVSKSSVKVNSKVKFTGKCGTLATGKVTIQRKNGSGSWKNWKTVSLKAGSYSVSYKMTSKGTSHFRSKVKASSTQVGGTSDSVKVVVK
jgi:hypothetical protein